MLKKYLTDRWIMLLYYREVESARHPKVPLTQGSPFLPLLLLNFSTEQILRCKSKDLSDSVHSDHLSELEVVCSGESTKIDVVEEGSVTDCRRAGASRACYVHAEETHCCFRVCIVRSG